MSRSSRIDVAPTGLPVEAARAEIEHELAHGSVVIRAEPGAGKSSLVPLFVASSFDDLGDPTSSVIVTEPRRLAVRATAARLAELAGSRVGDVVGFTVRGERKVSNTTRIEVVTEAVLTNRIQTDPDLPGVGAIVFDEFHERHLHSDLGLAMSLEAREALRPDLRLVVMSATLEAERLRDLVGGRTVIDVPGRTFPVETVYRTRPDRRRLADAVADATLTALDEVDGDVLVFVPGRREIDDTLRAIDRRLTSRHSIELLGLHGSTSVDAQRSILRGGARRRVVVATAVAETSITVPGIEAVVDGGLLRRSRFDAATGLGRLETGHATVFAADQRRGRAGRLGPGRCYRLWAPDDHRHLDVAAPPEIVDGDPLPVAFELARWGDPWADDLPLLDHPGRQRLQAGQRVLELLGLTDSSGRLTPAGEQAASLGLHPRLAALTLTAAATGQTGLGLRTAALLDDDSWPQRPDLGAELEQRWGTLSRTTERLARRLGSNDTGSRAGLAELGFLLAKAWPDRIAIARPDRPGRFLLNIGREVEVDPADPLAAAAFLVVADADGDPRSARVRRAVGVDRSTVLEAAGDHVEWIDHVEWDQRDDTLRAERRQRLGSIVLHRQPLDRPPVDAVRGALRDGLRSSGLDLLRWGERGVGVRSRLAWLHDEDPEQWPDLGDDALLGRLDEWLDLGRCRSVADLRRLDATEAVLSLLPWEQRRRLDELAPPTLDPPKGRPQPIRYESGRPVWSVRLQHLFGLDEHPTVGPHRTPLTIELLSPANRPTQITTDLPGFWRGSYRAVRADLRGRYPKHPWPEDPLAP
ncbi:MAG: ATP-dependent helicase HrpB [Acidimicrobiales bacterium]